MDLFDPMDRKHVEWLKKFTEANTEEKFKFMNKNPMNCEFSGAEMVHVLFGTCTKYAQAVLKNKAFILPPDDC